MVLRDSLVLKDQKGKKLGSWEAVGVFRSMCKSQED